MEANRYINGKEAARRAGLDVSYVASLARKSAAEGNPWPIKRRVGSRAPWEAPPEEWEKILQPITKRKKKLKPRNTLGAREQGSIEDPDAQVCYSARQAAKILNVAGSWLSVLGERCIKLGREWPQKEIQARIAPLEEWRKILKDEDLRAWTRRNF
ncbi:hypothetical protein [Thermoactinomyces sp. DSM 45892]|uniref:hypothetical protein n=1 Tax=Thermoactinomyces sp. DSM 45892 TaxID=1882753 RepID=UPI000898FC48|nr:hypothetical protein [Thermoactinomyces sp. DSM 45892]SDY83082.1 hypothetical protein SAMN05444416_10916 [Thermoactinomyces sp. DSM 45892]